LYIDLNAFAPSFAVPNNDFNCTEDFLIAIPALTNPLITSPAPNPIKAFFKIKYRIVLILINLFEHYLMLV
jgi:hypothetical protein